MPTKIDQDQISGLPDDLNSLESFISVEDSIGDSADVSQDSALSTLQEELNLLKVVCQGLLFPRHTYIYQDGDTFRSGGETQEYPIPVTVTYSWEFADDPESFNFVQIDGADQPLYTPVYTSSYLYRLKITYASALGVVEALSQALIYFSPSGGTPG